MGKRKRNYPKRSEIIKIDKIHDSPKKVETALINQAPILVDGTQNNKNPQKVENNHSNGKFNFESNDWYYCLHCHRYVCMTYLCSYYRVSKMYCVHSKVLYQNVPT